MIRLEHLGYDYTDMKGVTHPLLEDISFEVKSGEKVLLLGINGCGKSTLLKLLNGLVFAQKGKYFFEDEEVSKAWVRGNKSHFRKSCGLLMQDPNTMLFNPTVYDEIAFGIDMYALGDTKERVQHWAKLFGITKHLDSAPYHLSGGEKQKVALASVLATEPNLLLLDEPTSYLDPPMTGWFVEFLESLDATVLITTHNLSLGGEMADRALVLSPEHRLIYDGAVKALLGDEQALHDAHLLHRHVHLHDGEVHAHFHLHDWN